MVLNPDRLIIGFYGFPRFNIPDRDITLRPDLWKTFCPRPVNSISFAMAYGAVKTTPDAAARPAGSSASQTDDNINGNASQAPQGSDAADEQSTTFWSRTKAFYQNNIGLFFVFLAQIFASIVRKPPSHHSTHVPTLADRHRWP